MALAADEEPVSLSSNISDELPIDYELLQDAVALILTVLDTKIEHFTETEVWSRVAERWVERLVGGANACAWVRAQFRRATGASIRHGARCASPRRMTPGRFARGLFEHGPMHMQSWSPPTAEPTGA
ncbi:MAG: hypothetical protein IT370_05245 [Deltaproteobacteria bacterium]|nr:hypothetical protein [Deltaproteobacteria bacterium]